jgi:hypothetical protein
MKRLLAIVLLLVTLPLSADTLNLFNYVRKSGSTMTGPLLIPDGSASAPGLGFSSASNTGITRISGVITFVDSGGTIAGINGNASIGLQLRSAAPLSWSSSSSVNAAGDTMLYRDAAGTLALRNGTNAQAFRICNTCTDASNYERGVVGWVSNVLKVGTEKGGTGTARGMTFITDGTDRWQISSGGTFFPATTYTYTLGGASNVIHTTYTARLHGGGNSPSATCTNCGTGGTVTVNTGSSDSFGSLTINTGTTPGAGGTLVLTYSSALGTNSALCVWTLAHATSNWNGRATVIRSSGSNTSTTVTWDNNGVNLTASSTYAMYYHCAGI